MSGQKPKTKLRAARDEIGYSREYVVRRSELEPQMSTKTLERYEKGETPIKKFRLQQLASIYRVQVDDLDGIVENVA